MYFTTRTSSLGRVERWDSGRDVGRWSVRGGVSSRICSRRWNSGRGDGRWSVRGGVSSRICSRR